MHKTTQLRVLLGPLHFPTISCVNGMVWAPQVIKINQQTLLHI